VPDDDATKPDADPDQATLHVCGPSTTECKCNCPDSCEHVWDGPGVEEGLMNSVTCSRCGMTAFAHSMWVNP